MPEPTKTKIDIVEILQLMEESNFVELRLEIGDTKLTVRKRGIQSSLHETEANSPSMPNELPAEKSEPSFPEKDAAQPKEQIVPESTLRDTYKEIKAPMAGMFYRSPRPGTPPFVEIGAHVTEQDTVCIMEIMKTMNTVKAGLRGRIAKVCVDNNQLVEHGQILFLVDPDGA